MNKTNKFPYKINLEFGTYPGLIDWSKLTLDDIKMEPGIPVKHSGEVIGSVSAVIKEHKCGCVEEKRIDCEARWRLCHFHTTLVCLNTETEEKAKNNARK